MAVATRLGDDVIGCDAAADASSHYQLPSTFGPLRTHMTTTMTRALKKKRKKKKKTAQGHKYIICRRAIFHSHNQRPKSDTKIRDTFLLLKDFRFKNKFKKTNRWRLVSVSVCSDVKNDFQLLVAEGEQTVDVQLSMAVNWFFSPNMTDDTPCLYAMKRCLKTLFEGSHSVDLSWRDKPHKKEAERERERERESWETDLYSSTRHKVDRSSRTLNTNFSMLQYNFGFIYLFIFLNMTPPLLILLLFVVVAVLFTFFFKSDTSKTVLTLISTLKVTLHHQLMLLREEDLKKKTYWVAKVKWLNKFQINHNY